jgi:hypothetical protein
MWALGGANWSMSSSGPFNSKEEVCVGFIAGLDVEKGKIFDDSVGVPTSELSALNQVTIPTELCPNETEMLKQREDSLSRHLSAQLQI